MEQNQSTEEADTLQAHPGSVPPGSQQGPASKESLGSSGTAARRAPWGGITRYSPSARPMPPSAVIQAALASGRTMEQVLGSRSSARFPSPASAAAALPPSLPAAAHSRLP